MNARAGRAARWLACALLGLGVLAGAGGCQGVGRAVVGQKPPMRAGSEACDGPTPDCDATPPPAAPDGVPPMAAPIELAGCALVPPPAACGLPPVHAGDSSDCRAPLRVDAAGAGQAALASQQCQNLSILDDRAQPAERVLRLEAASLESVNVSLQSSLPLTLELAEATLTHVWFELRGPVTLRIVSSRALSDVRVSAPAGREAAFELDQANGAELSVGTQTAPFAGALAIRRSTLRRVQLTAESIELESVALSDLALTTSRLEAADATLTRCALQARRSLLASCTVSAASFSECDTFSAIQGTFQDTRLEACSDAARLYGAKFSSGALDGALVLDHAELKHVRLGLLEPVEIAAWDVQITNARLCSAGASASVGGSSTIACVLPRAGVGCDVDVCVVPQAMLQADTPDCEPFLEAATCAAPEPERMRPPYP
jgi:hypothetical protein